MIERIVYLECECDIFKKSITPTTQPTFLFGGLAQLARALDLHSRGQGFDSLILHIDTDQFVFKSSLKRGPIYIDEIYIGKK